MLGLDDHEGSGAVVDARGISGRDRATLAEGRLQTREVGGTRAWPRVLVTIHDEHFPGCAGHLHRHDLGVETTLLDGSGNTCLAAHGEGILLLPTDAPPVGDELGGLA